MDDTETPSDQPLFRPSKRRKVLRQRRPSDSELEPDGLSKVEREDDGQVDAASVVQKIRKSRVKIGIDVSHKSNTQQQSSNTHDGDDALQSASISATGGMLGKQFAPQTGLVKDDLDKHITAYVDSRLAQIRGPSTTSDPNKSPNPSAQLSANKLDAQGTSKTVTPTNVVGRMPAGAGKLQEIDLGPDTARQNELRTKAAMLGEHEETVDKRNDPRKARWRRRQRRTSEDIKRDKMVEAVFNEAKLEKYDRANIVAAKSAVGDTDDRFVEEFKREFLDSQISRGGQSGPAKKKDAVDPLKGPKLGGSRSARAAMHASLQQKGDSSKR